jgi:hypothetical protein
MTCSGYPSTFHRMPRKPRGEFAGARYHVIARGNQLAPIFHADADYTAVSHDAGAPVHLWSVPQVTMTTGHVFQKRYQLPPFSSLPTAQLPVFLATSNDTLTISPILPSALNSLYSTSIFPNLRLAVSIGVPPSPDDPLET